MGTRPAATGRAVVCRMMRAWVALAHVAAGSVIAGGSDCTDHILFEWTRCEPCCRTDPELPRHAARRLHDDCSAKPSAPMRSVRTTMLGASIAPAVVTATTR